MLYPSRRHAADLLHALNTNPEAVRGRDRASLGCSELEVNLAKHHMAVARQNREELCGGAGRLVWEEWSRVAENKDQRRREGSMWNDKTFAALTNNHAKYPTKTFTIFQFTSDEVIGTLWTTLICKKTNMEKIVNFPIHESASNQNSNVRVSATPTLPCLSECIHGSQILSCWLIQEDGYQNHLWVRHGDQKTGRSNACRKNIITADINKRRAREHLPAKWIHQIERKETQKQIRSKIY